MNNNSSTKEIQKASLCILKDFISACEKLGIMYYVGYGTLLGTIRHKGFIPWDDDVDVCMPRKDYEIFISRGRQFLPDHYFIQTANSEPEFMCSYAKLRDSKTTYIENINRRKKMNHGIFIDIFPLDYLPENELRARLKAYRFTMQKTRTQYKMAKGIKEPNVKEKIKKAAIMTLFPSAKSALKGQLKVGKAKPSSRYVVYQWVRYNMRGVCPVDLFGDGKMMPFEDIDVRVPNDYDTVLKIIYGDYMQLPPPEARTTTHDCFIIDAGTPYEKYT